MFNAQNQSISKKLTWMNMLVSGAALLMACLAFIGYDLLTFRETAVHNLSTQAQIIGSNSVSAMLFNDPQAAEQTLSALKDNPDILQAVIYEPDGHPLACTTPALQDEPIPAFQSRFLKGRRRSTGSRIRKLCWRVPSSLKGRPMGRCISGPMLRS